MDEKDISNGENMIKEEALPLIEQISDQMPGGFFIYNADGNEELIYVNKAMLRIFGCKDEEELRKITNNSFKGIVHPDDYKRVTDSINKQIADSPYSLDYVEYRITRADGTIRWVEDYGHYLPTSDGGIFYVFIEDATERMEERMEELERINGELQEVHTRDSQYRKAILHDAVTFFEINLSKDTFISSVPGGAANEADNLSGLAGGSPASKYSEFIEVWINRMTENERDEYREFFSAKRLIECYKKGEPKQILETAVTDSAGVSKLLQFMILIGKNESTGDIVALAVVKDITEANAKQRLFQTALSEANVENVAKQIVISNISHKISTPINSIRSFTEMIEYNAANPSILKYCLEKVRAASDELLEVVSEALAIPDMKSQMTILGVSQCDLHDLLNDIRQRILPVAAQRQIHFTLDESGVKNSGVYANAIQLEEVIWQLVDNAVKYTRKGGKVSLKACESSDAPKGFAVYSFEIADTGVGMDKKFIESIFEKRQHDTGTPGGGLGIAVVKNIVDIMKGTVTVDSELGKGSTFTVSLTLPHREPGGNESGEVFDPMPTVGKHILIVDDDEITLNIEQSLLESCGYIVDTAMNGKQAMKKILAENAVKYDIILLDIRMPVMDGYETAEAIRRADDPQIANVPLIAISAEAFEQEREKAFSYGINEHLSKPINVAELQNTIAKILQL